MMKMIEMIEERRIREPGGVPIKGYHKEMNNQTPLIEDTRIE